MSLTTAQRYQVLRLMVPDATVDSEDQWALLGLVEPASFEITSTQKKQILRLPVVDASVTTSDKFAFLGLMEPVNPGGNIVERFTVEWYIDPTWTGGLQPELNDGYFSIQVGAVTGGLTGVNAGPSKTDGKSQTLKRSGQTAYRRISRGILGGRR